MNNTRWRSTWIRKQSKNGVSNRIVCKYAFKNTTLKTYNYCGRTVQFEHFEAVSQDWQYYLSWTRWKQQKKLIWRVQRKIYVVIRRSGFRIIINIIMSNDHGTYTIRPWLYLRQFFAAFSWMLKYIMWNRNEEEKGGRREGGV